WKGRSTKVLTVAAALAPFVGFFLHIGVGNPLVSVAECLIRAAIPWPLFSLIRRHRAFVVELGGLRNRFRDITEAAPGVFWIIDAKTYDMLYVSPSYERIWKRSRRRLFEDPYEWSRAVHENDADRTEKAFFEMLSNGTFDEEYRIVRPDGSVRWIYDRGAIVLGDDGKPVRLVGLAEDITDRREHAAKLQGANSDIEMILRRVSESSRETSESGVEAERLVQKSQELVDAGLHAMRTMSTTIQQMKDAAVESERVVRTIDDIAFNTNLLAVNAAIEAARAGDAGTGFGVVAEEVGDLSSSCGKAVASTSAIIQESQQLASEGVRVTEEAEGSFEEIAESVERLGALVEQIARANLEQTGQVEQVHSSMCSLVDDHEQRHARDVVL
ncbi:MAG: methyl-accepting chemotaxis protein, partial [Planctomycetota bacterium]